MFKQAYFQRPQEEDDIPLCQYVIPYHQQQQQQQLQQQHLFQWKSRQCPQPFARLVSHPVGYFPPMIITQPQSIVTRRPSYPTTPSSLLAASDEDEDDEDLVPIAVLQSPIRNQQQFQSAAEKYKEKVKAQLQ